MEREDYYRRRALELLAVARAVRDPGAADWLREIAFGYQRLANRLGNSKPEQYLPLTDVA
jgi:hypothetical protein